MGEGRRKLLKQTADVDEEKLLLKYDDADAHDNNKGDDGGGDDGIWSDVDNDSKSSDLDDTDSSDDSDDSDEDEEALLQAELARIRAEREDANQKAQQKAKEEE